MTDENIEDKKTKKGTLPGEHGQFGENNATEEYRPLEEEYRPLEDHPVPGEPGDQGAKQTDAGARS